MERQVGPLRMGTPAPRGRETQWTQTCLHTLPGPLEAKRDHNPVRTRTVNSTTEKRMGSVLVAFSVRQLLAGAIP